MLSLLASKPRARLLSKDTIVAHSLESIALGNSLLGPKQETSRVKIASICATGILRQLSPCCSDDSIDPRIRERNHQ